MLDSTQIILFCSTSLLLAITPGPDIIYVITRGITQGHKSGMAAAAGFSLGNIAHTTFAIVGLSAIIRSSALAFTAIKIAGAIYLIYIGWKTFTSKGGATAEKDTKILSPKAVFIQSITANILNPKVALFFIAFFPQFIKPQNGHPAIQMALLGLLFIICTFIVFSACALFSGQIGEKLKNSKGAGYLNKAAGAVLMGLGVALAFSKRS
ncbi:LysE family translocator [Seleniivibrio sp.]|uniref:LysE family translocator n=1 Tax=Seleniivibrio sp. TaxID=2898801 RepID=UPI0025F8E920|nr:LysE family translocator [Seleniivibrio sp.]MCD8554851.1 LysE family translocator [Seleniivibrio sp.]